MTLSGWFREYVYIPLGGSRCAKSKMWRNQLFVFLLSGLWHGASWHFVVWGALNGIYQILEDMIGGAHRKSKAARSVLCRGISIGITFILVDFAWMFFRVNSMADGWYAVTHLLQGWSMEGIQEVLYPVIGGKRALLRMVLPIGVLFGYDAISRYKMKVSEWIKQQQRVVRWGIYYTMLIVVFVFFLQVNAGYGSVGEFIYFQF